MHGLPLAADIKRADPGHRVVWVAQPAPAQVLRHHPHVDDVLLFDTATRMRGLRHVVGLWRRMRGLHADLTLNAQRYLKSLWPTVFSGAPVRVGLPRSKTRDGIFLAHTHALEDGPWKHTQDLFLDFRWALGVSRDAPVSWDVTFSPEERAEQQDFFDRRTGRRTVGLVLASAGPAKDWPVECYAELADALAADFELDVILLAGPSARERERAAHVVRNAASEPTDCVGDGLRRLMWLVDGCRLIVSPDTGPLHIAHALDVPVIGLYGHTNPWRVGPYRRFTELVVDRYTEPGEAPDPASYHPKAHRMERISLGDVLEKVEVALRRYPSGRGGGGRIVGRPAP